MKDLLFLTLEMDDGSLFLINIYLHTDHDGYIRCIRHSADDIQTELATFPFENMRLVQTVKEVQSSLHP